MAEQERTVFCGNLSNEVTDELLYELFLQSGPLERVTIAIDRASGSPKGFAFIVFQHVESVDYTIKLMQNISLFGRRLNLQRRSGQMQEQTKMSDPNSSNMLNRSRSMPVPQHAQVMQVPPLLPMVIGGMIPQMQEVLFRQNQSFREQYQSGGRYDQPQFSDRDDRWSSSSRRSSGTHRDERNNRSYDRQGSGSRDPYPQRSSHGHHQSGRDRSSRHDRYNR